MVSPARVRRRSMRLALVALLLSGPAWASDEVDYSAPYLTLEDGKLVTKYPAKVHTGAAPAVGATTDASDPGAVGPGPASQAPADATGAAEKELPVALFAAAVVTGFVAAGVLLSRRRNKRRPPGNG